MEEINDIEFGIILPKYDNSGRKIDPRFAKEVAIKMSKRFGGVTTFPTVLGCWVSDRGDLQCEENILITSIRDTESIEDKPVHEQIEEDRRFMEELGRECGKLFGQASVMETSGRKEVSFIEGRYREELPKRMVFKDIFTKHF